MPRIATAERVDLDALPAFLRPRHQAVLPARLRRGGGQLSSVSCGSTPELIRADKV